MNNLSKKFLQMNSFVFIRQNSTKLINFRKNSFAMIHTKKLETGSSISSKSFSSAKPKVNLEDRIKLVDDKDVDIKNEDFAENICTAIENESYQRCNEYLSFMEERKIKLKTRELNQILSMIYMKHFDLMETVRGYIMNFDIEMDSMSYNYSIIAYLYNKQFTQAYEQFCRADELNVPQNLSVIIALLKELSILQFENYLKYTKTIDDHVERFYSGEIIE